MDLDTGGEVKPLNIFLPIPAFLSLGIRTYIPQAYVNIFNTWQNIEYLNSITSPNTDKHFGPDITPAIKKNSIELSFVFSDKTVTSIAIDKKINNSENENN